MASSNKSPFKRPTRLEAIYRRELERLLDSYMTIPTTATLGEISARLVEYGQAANFIQRFAKKTAQRMVSGVLVNNANSWRQAASISSNGKLIHQMLKSHLNGRLGDQVDELTRENARLITTVPNNIAHVLTKYIATRQMEGIRSEQIAKEIHKKLPRLKAFQIDRIARTEVAKADTAVTRVRAQAIHLNWYQWETSEDQRVRKAHQKMDRVLVNWSDAPAPEQLAHERSQGHYHAGNIYNCRCVALPVVRLDQIAFPAKVYVNGSIKLLTRKQFYLISGMPLSLAA
jgi:SPP1 gp7 family putative phage head morphogenesis protein